MFIPLKSTERVTSSEAATLARECVEHGYGNGSQRKEHRVLLSLPAGPVTQEPFGYEGDEFTVIKVAIDRVSDNYGGKLGRLILPGAWAPQYAPQSKNDAV